MDRFSRPRQLLYANGHFGFSILDNLFGVYLIFFLLPPKEIALPQLVNNEPLFLGLTLVGLIVIFGRIVDSLADPLVAWWSDNTSFRIGRRKFFLVTGALPFALMAALLFFPPVDGVSGANAWYTAIILGLYFFFYTYYMSPNLALIPEISRNHDERISITVMQAVFSIAGAGVVLIAVPMLRQGLEGAGMSTGASFRLSMVILAAVAAVSLLLSAAPIDERRFSGRAPAGVGLLESIKMTISNSRFIIYMIATILYWFGFNVIRTIIAYYPLVLLGRPPEFQTMLMVALFGTAVVFFLLLPILAKRFSNKQLMLAGMLSFAVLMTFTLFVDQFGDARSAVALVHMGLMGFPVAVLLVIPNAAIADLSELDGRKTGKNREAMFFGTQGLFMKVNYGIAGAITASLFAFFGKDVAEPLGVKMAGPVGAAFVLVGFLVLLRYPQKQISRELDQYRETDDAPAS
jgi:glycoside/pentoside/hexuronide:cation symporter, GPH family